MTRHSYPSLPPADDAELRAALKARLTRLSYKALSLCVERVLEEIGITGIRALGRNHLRGRTAFGGADLYGNAATAFGPRPVLVQITRSRHHVPRHRIDELRGVILRYGVPQGLCVATSTFSRPAQVAANGYRGRPIRLIDGDELVGLMVTHRIGIRLVENLLTREKEWAVDDEAFSFLRRFALKRFIQPGKEHRDGRRRP